MFTTAKDKFRLKKLDVYNEKSEKLRDLIRELETLLKTNLTDEYRSKLSKSLQKLTGLQTEYDAVKDYIVSLKSIHEPEPEEKEQEEHILSQKRISLTDIHVLTTSESSVKIKLIPQLNLRESHEFTLQINTKGEQAEITKHNLPPFIPYKISFDLKLGKEKSIQTILRQIIRYLECYLVRRENVKELKERFLGPVLRNIDTSSSFNIINMKMDISLDDGDLFEVSIGLHYHYDNVVANEVRLSGMDEQDSILEDMKEASGIFLTIPLLSAFDRFATN